MKNTGLWEVIPCGISKFTYVKSIFEKKPLEFNAFAVGIKKAAHENAWQKMKNGWHKDAQSLEIPNFKNMYV